MILGIGSAVEDLPVAAFIGTDAFDLSGGFQLIEMVFDTILGNITQTLCNQASTCLRIRL